MTRGPGRTTACSRRPPASARASLRLPGTAEAQRSAYYHVPVISWSPNIRNPATSVLSSRRYSNLYPQGTHRMSEVVFYSWQSDLPNATNRGFIQQALEQAVKSIASDESLSVEPVIVRDTSGVPGSPEIARTIFNKIGRAAVFVADVSIINRAERGTGRPTPNPNVLVELGYALHALGPTRVLLVLNAAYGEPEQLPFDLRMRRTIAYCMPEKAFSRSAERKKLEKGLSVALRAIFQHKVDSTTALATTSGARGKRIGMVIQLMNEAWGYENFSVSSIADMLGMEYINEL